MTRWRAAGLLTWAITFWWLWLSGSWVRFVGPRTAWIVPFGTIVLTAVAVGAWVARAEGPGKANLRGMVTLLTFVAPVLLLVLVPEPRLGAIAAANRTGGLTAGGMLPAPGGDGELSLRDIDYASTSADSAALLGVVEGREVELEGFVTHPDFAGAYALTRFSMWCCAADALPASVEVLDEADFTDDTWLRVKGVIRRSGNRYAIEPTSTTRIDEPRDPYEP